MIINNRHILEAVNRGIKLALDDYEDIDDNSSVSSKQDIIDGGHFVEYARFRHIIKMLLYGDPSLSTKLDQIRVYKELIELHKKFGFTYTVETLENLRFIIKQFISIWRTTTNNFNWVDVSRLTSLKYAFDIPAIRADVGWVEIDEWDVSNVTDMSFFAWQCTYFEADLSKWDVSNLKYAGGAFLGCEKFNSNLSNWNVSNLIGASQMFKKCKSFNSDLSNWDVSNIQNANQMFWHCDNLQQDFSKWDLDKCNIGNRDQCRQIFAYTPMEYEYDLYPDKLKNHIY